MRLPHRLQGQKGSISAAQRNVPIFRKRIKLRSSNLARPWALLAPGPQIGPKLAYGPAAGAGAYCGGHLAAQLVHKYIYAHVDVVQYSLLFYLFILQSECLFMSAIVRLTISHT